MNISRESLKTSEKVKYSAGLYSISLSYVAVSTLLVYFYTEIMGIPPKTASFIFSVGAIVDVAISIVLPLLILKGNSKLGKYRPVLIIDAIPLGMSVALLFFKPSISGASLLIYAFLGQIFYRITFSCASMPHASLISRLSSDANERATIGSFKGVASGLGMLTAAYLGITTVKFFGNGDEVRGFTYFGVIFGIVISAVLAWSAIGVKERVADIDASDDTKSIARALLLLCKNRHAVVSLAAILFFFSGFMVMIGSVIYYFKYIVRDPSLTKYAIVAIAIGAIVSPLIWEKIIRLTSKSFCWVSGCVIMAACLISLYLFHLPVLTVIAIYFLCGFGEGAVKSTWYSIIADAIDYGHWKHRERVEAYGFGMLALFTKSGETLGAAFLSALLAWAAISGTVGIEDLAQESRLRFVVFMAPAVILFLSASFMYFFRISAEMQKNILKDLRRGIFYGDTDSVVQGKL